MKNPIIKQCEVCGKTFTANPRIKNPKYCCLECQKVAQRKRNSEKKRLASIEKYKNNPDAVVCQICGWMGEDLNAHIALGHNMTQEEYCRRFNLTPDKLISKKNREMRIRVQKESKSPNKHRFTSENNPGINHGGKLSPFSKNFVGYKNLTEEEKEDKIHATAAKLVTTRTLNNNDTTTVQYYQKHFGVDTNVAERMLSERQRTFSLNICIDKLGEEEGTKVWQARQEQWQSSLWNKTPEELLHMWRRRAQDKVFYSEPSQIFCKDLEQLFKLFGWTLYYATHDPKMINDEWCVITDTKDAFFFDLYIKELNIDIEFDDDYHLTEKQLMRDKARDEKLSAMGFKILRIPAKDWRLDKGEVYKKCMEFVLKHK